MVRNWRGMFVMETSWRILGVEVGPDLSSRRRDWHLPGAELRLRFAFGGYTPGCFPKSGEVVEKIGFAEGIKPRVWKVLYLKEFGLGLVRTGAGGRVMLQDNTG
jgi:hypothetical protein